MEEEVDIRRKEGGREVHNAANLDHLAGIHQGTWLKGAHDRTPEQDFTSALGCRASLVDLGTRSSSGNRAHAG
jgi:hypothetical protein